MEGLQESSKSRFCSSQGIRDGYQDLFHLYKDANKKDIPMIMAAHKIPYMATVSVAYPQDLQRKLKKAKEIKGFKYIHAMIPCPTGWRFDPAKAIEISKLQVDTWTYTFYEVEKGVLTVSRKAEAKPVIEYLSLQNRFRRLSEEQVAYIQTEVDKKREDLLAMDGKKVVF